MKFKELLKQNGSSFADALLSGIFPFFLLPTPIFALVAALLSWVGSFAFLIKAGQENHRREREVASLSFLSSFLGGLINEGSVSKSYEEACRYLIGYEDPLPYAELLNQKAVTHFALEERNDILNYILQKDKENEAHLPDYSYVEKQVNSEIEKKTKAAKQIERRRQLEELLFLVTFLGLTIFFALFPSGIKAMTMLPAQIVATLGLGLLFPTIECIHYVELKGINHV